MVKNEEIQDICSAMTVTDRISTMLICFQGKEGEDFYGEILNCYIEKPVCFFGIGDMILKLDEICDWIGSPQPTTEPRFLNKKMAEQYALRNRRNNIIPEKASIQLQNSMVLYSQASRAKNTLLIKIEFRQNATMQGRVIGKLTSKKYISFRSALELMRMIKEIAIKTESTYR
ncbi:MAG: hypothetical protein ACRC36_26510 [Lacrimispora sphenoides]